MITVIARYTAAGGAADVVRGRTGTARQAGGCLTLRAGLAAVRRPPRLDNPDKFALVERYEQQAAVAEHRRRPHFRRNGEADLVEPHIAQSRTMFRPAL